MGKLITKKIRGFSWKAKISLVLSFTVLFSVFMYQGWYKPKKAQAADKVIILTSGTSWTVPADWSATNTIEVIGGGGAGSSSAQGSAGGGGGAYAKVTNVAGLSGSVTINVGAGGTDGVVVPTATWFNGADCASASVCGDFGTNALNNTAGTGGTTGNSVGTVLYAGGSGGIGNTTGDTGGGGGGAAGPSGSGKAGGTGISGAASGGGGGSNGGASAAGGNSTATVGGKGGNGFSGTGGPNGTVNAGTNATAGTGAGGSGAGGTTVTPGGDGAMQVVWTATDLTTAGPGGGGGGAGNNGTGGSAGGFGGGGGGGETLGGSGTGGVIVITYTPAVDTTPPTVSSTTPASGATDVTVNSSLQVVFNENIDCTSAAAGNISMAGATVGAPSCSAPTTTITYPISGQAGNTLYTYTIGGVKDVIGNTMATTANRTYTTAAAPEAPNAVSATGTAIAAAATDTQANVVMQRLTLNSDTVTDSNNQVVLSTLTLDDAGNATAIATVKVYISSTSSATLPANAILLGGKSNWDGASTVLGLVGGKVIDRTVAAGTPKYLYIVYDMAFDQSTRTVQAHVSNVGVSSPDTSAAVNLSSTLITLSDGSNVAVVTACTSCHAMPPLDASGTARNTPATAVVGSHLKHGNTCSNCHVTPATQTSADFGHRNGNIEFIGGVAYSKGNSFAQTNPTDGTGLGTCNTATCHNAYGTTGIATPKWGVAATCASCHAASPATGNHALHMGLSGAACNQCHDGAVAGSNGGTAHLDYNIDVTGGYPANVARHASGSGYSSCSSASCHNDPYSSGFAATPTWGTTGNGCSACHLAHPLVSTGPATGSHAKHNQTDCSKCHAGATNNITNPTLNHNDGDIDVTNGYPVTARHAAGTYTGTCNSASCHANVYGSGTVTTPVWGDTTQGCGACHTTAIATTGPATGSHAAHNETNCSLCHAGATNSTTGPTLNHADGDIDVLNGYPVTAKHAAGSYTGTCTSASCHADPYSAAYAETPVWGNSGAGCSSCHGAKPITATGPATGAHSKHMGLTGAACTQCHNAGTSATSSPTTAHGNANVDVIGGYPTTVAKHAFGTGYSSCSTSNYCHSSGQSSTGTAVPVYATSPNWGSTGTTCASCHKNMDSDATAYGNHVKHAQTYAISCASCHNGYTETTVAAATHVNNLIETSFSGTLATGTTYSQANGAVGNGYGNCTTSYCHSSGQAANGTATPVYASATWGATTNCGSCHLNFDSNASATGDHVAHAQTYPYTCATCHDGYTETTSAPATHVNKVVELAFSGTLATGTTYSQGNGAVGNGFGTCSTSYCHSTGQSTTGGATPTYPGTAPTWGTTTMNCGSCHLDFNSNASATGDHVKHAQGTANLSCATCHNGYTETTVATATHVNKTIELAFSGTNATGTTYSQGATSAVGNNYGNCSTSKCHGSGAPVWGGALFSATVICENCHGSAASSPFYSTAATGAAPTKTTAETDSKVGAHLAHLTARAAYTNTISCGTCHGVPATVTTAGHMDGSATPAFSGTALLNSASPSYVSGSCSNTYCHGAAMIGGSNNGTDTSPAWTATGYITGTPSKTGDCAACHGCPPNSAAHGGSETLAQCNGCHDHVNVDGSFTSGTNRGKHMDGTVQASGGDCLGCHSSLVAADFVRPSRHVSNGTTTSIVTNFDCIVCHSEGDANSSGTTINRTTLHSGNSSGPVDLRNVDSAVTGAGTANTNYWAWPGRRATPLAKGSANTTSRDNMDRFCMGCHDANGASTIAVNNSNDGLIVGSAAVSTVRTVTGTGNTNTNNANLAQRPFNTNDKLQNTRDTGITGSGTTIGTHRLVSYGRVLNVKSQFNSGDAAGTSWASHHNLNQFVKRYTTNNTTAGTGLPTTVWTNYVNKEGYTLSGTGAGTGANAGLHCSDCHLNEVNAHGSVNSWYMLNGSATASDTDIAPTQGNSSTSAEISCFRCHTANVYAVGGSSTAGRVDHNGRCNNVDVVTGTSVEAPFSNMCHGCHGGYGNTALAVNKDVVGTGSTTFGRGALGAIHGNNETYRPGGATADSPRYRFISGASMRFWNPSNTATANWAATSGGTCYTLSAADQWGSCTKHSGGAGQTINSGRALSY